MAEIPSWMWIFSGLLITGFSVFMGYIRPVQYAAFFRLMLWVGLIMIVFGLIKFKLSQRTREDMFDEMRQRQHQRGQNEVELGQRPVNTGYPQGYNQQGYNQGANRQPMHNAQHRAHQPVHNANHSTAHHQNAHQAQHPHNSAHNISHSNQHYGYPTQANTHNQKSQSKFCHQCGTPLLGHHKFCPMCGSRV